MSGNVAKRPLTARARCGFAASGAATRVRVQTEAGWVECAERSFDPRGVQAVEAEVSFPRA